MKTMNPLTNSFSRIGPTWVWFGCLLPGVAALAFPAVIDRPGIAWFLSAGQAVVGSWVAQRSADGLERLGSRFLVHAVLSTTLAVAILLMVKASGCCPSYQ